MGLTISGIHLTPEGFGGRDSLIHLIGDHIDLIRDHIHLSAGGSIGWIYPSLPSRDYIDATPSLTIPLIHPSNLIERGTGGVSGRSKTQISGINTAQEPDGVTSSRSDAIKDQDDVIERRNDVIRDHMLLICDQIDPTPHPRLSIAEPAAPSRKAITGRAGFPTRHGKGRG